MVKVLIYVAWFVVMIIYMKHILSLQVIPERAMKTYINEKYLYNGNIFIKRHGRKSKYYVNIEGYTKRTFSDNVSLHLIFLELQQNEYKQSFVEGHFKICEIFRMKSGIGPYIAAAFRNAGFVCPLPPGPVSIMNISIPADNFPNVWPFERCKVQASLTQTPTNDIIATADVYIYFKQTPRSG